MEIIALHCTACLWALYKQDHRNALHFYGDDDDDDVDDDDEDDDDGE